MAIGSVIVAGLSCTASPAQRRDPRRCRAGVAHQLIVRLAGQRHGVHALGEASGMSHPAIPEACSPDEGTLAFV